MQIRAHTTPEKSPEPLARWGQIVFGLGIASLGVLNFIFFAPVAGLQPVPAWVPGQFFLVCLTGAVLIGAGACILLDRHVQSSATVLGILLLVWLIFLQAPNLAARPRSGNVWTTVFETLALCGAAWALAGSSAIGRNTRGRWDKAPVLVAVAGRICFGVSLIIFGGLHFIYARFVATLVPVWMPWRLFWSYFTGAAFVAAGVSIVTKVKGPLAATLLGVMFGTWVLILHAPRAALKATDRSEWTSLLIATAMCGGAWLLTGTLVREDHVN